MQRRSSIMGTRPFWSGTKTVVAGIALAGSLLANGMAWAQFPGLPTEPGTDGDQLVYFYDARPDHTTFLTIANTATTASVILELVYYSGSLDSRIAETTLTLPGGGAFVVSPSDPARRCRGRVGKCRTPRRDTHHERERPYAGRATPPLVGGFSIVNTVLGAGFGDNPSEDSPSRGPGAATLRAPIRDPVDGVNTSYQSIQPRTTEPSDHAARVPQPEYPREAADPRNGNR
jgi:hypothetical protein